MARCKSVKLNNEMEGLMERYIDYLNLLGKSQSTIINYLSTARRFLYDNEIETIEDIEELDNVFWLDWTKDKKESGISVTTINKQINQLSSMYGFLIMGEGLNVVNYCKQMKGLNVSSESLYKENVISDEEAKSLLSTADNFIKNHRHSNYSNCRDKTLVYLMLNIAPRIGEVSRIRIEDIELDNNKVYIRGKGHNGNISRYTNFNNKVKKLIIELISYNPNRIYLFENYKGEQLDTQSIRKIWYKCCDISNIKRFHPHEVRHRLGSVLINKGVDEQDVKFILGHSKNSQILRKYYLRDNGKDANDITMADDIF